jgi:hypothetical protein
VLRYVTQNFKRLSHESSLAFQVLVYEAVSYSLLVYEALSYSY